MLWPLPIAALQERSYPEYTMTEAAMNSRGQGVGASDPAATLVSRTRSSRMPGGKCDPELRVQRGTGIITLLMVLRFRGSYVNVLPVLTNFGIGLLACLAALLAPALCNGYPLLQFDTGGYLARWYEGYLVPSRSTVFG